MLGSSSRRSAFARLSNATRRMRYAAVSAIGDMLCPRFLSYSPYGEDKLVMGHLFARTGGDLSLVRYLDIGAADPVIGSNTYALYQRGARGVLVEPTPDKADLLRRTRPRDTVVQAGAAFDGTRSAELTLFGPGNAGLFNTFKTEQVQKVVAASTAWREQLRPVGKVEVPLVTITDIIAKYLGGTAPDFLSIDVEGYDYEVLGLLDWSVYRPILICVEASSGDLHSFMSRHGYLCICMSPDNLVFLKQ
jgi:FkbM family methyltransferase